MFVRHLKRKVIVKIITDYIYIIALSSIGEFAYKIDTLFLHMYVFFYECHVPFSFKAFICGKIPINIISLRYPSAESHTLRFKLFIDNATSF